MRLVGYLKEGAKLVTAVRRTRRYVICEAKIVGGGGDKIVGSNNIFIHTYRQTRKSRPAGQMEIKTHMLLTISKQGMEKILYARIVWWAEF